MNPVRLSLLSVALLLTTAAAADAAIFKGRTSQDRQALVETNDRRFPVRFFFRWRADCDSGTLTFTTGVHPPFKERTRDFVRDEGSYTGYVRDKDSGRRYRVRVRRVHMRARRVAPRRWEGAFGASAVVSRDGRVVARCQTGTITWRASR